MRKKEQNIIVALKIDEICFLKFCLRPKRSCFLYVDFVCRHGAKEVAWFNAIMRQVLKDNVPDKAEDCIL